MPQWVAVQTSASGTPFLSGGTFQTHTMLSFSMSQKYPSAKFREERLASGIFPGTIQGVHAHRHVEILSHTSLRMLQIFLLAGIECRRIHGDSQIPMTQGKYAGRPLYSRLESRGQVGKACRRRRDTPPLSGLRTTFRPGLAISTTRTGFSPCPGRVCDACPHRAGENRKFRDFPSFFPCGRIWESRRCLAEPDT